MRTNTITNIPTDSTPGARPHIWIATVLMALIVCAGSVQSKDIKVVTTIKPVHALASQVMDGIGTPKLLIDGVTSPHTFALKPSDAKALHQADLFVRIGPALEPFTKKISGALPKSVRVLTLFELPELTRHDIRNSGAFEAHAHHDKSHDHHDHHGHHDHDNETTETDPHIWLDPGNAIVIVEALVETLSQIAPDNADRFRNNGAQAIAELRQLDGELATKLAPITRAPFMVFHDAFQYFEKRFGLRGAGAFTLHPEAPPSAKRLAEIRQIIRKSGARCVFSEPQFSPRRIATTLEGTGAKTSILDPLGAKIPSGRRGYQDLMHALADQFIFCLKD